MRCYIEFVTVPTLDTPGTLLLLHYDDKRYIIGQLSEGSTRACFQRHVSFRKVSHVLLTGRTEWTNIGGLFGFTLSLADTQRSSLESVRENEKTKARKNEERSEPNAVKSEEDGSPVLKFDGPSRLNHTVAVCRRFIFRTGTPLIINEHRNTRRQADRDVSKPTWSDEKINVWAMSIPPSKHAGDAGSPATGTTRKRSFGELEEDPKESTNNGESSVFADDLLDESEDEAIQADKNIVHAMFSSDWAMDKLYPQRLHEVIMPAVIFVKDATTKKLVQYTGPMPGGPEPLPDIEVLVRKPWPGAQVHTLPRISQRKESVCYIVRNHPQRGRFLPKKALELGVEKGPNFGKLTNGQTVLNKNGETITPEMVLEPTKPGSGFAVLDLPSAEYIEALSQRPEWNNATATEQVKLMIWLLGPGVAMDQRLKDFQGKFPDVEHVISSPDTSADTFALESAVSSAWLHNYLNPEVFPKLLLGEKDVAPVSRTEAGNLAVRKAERSLRHILEPRWEFETKDVVPPLSIAELENSVRDSYSAFAEAAHKAMLEVSTQETQEWASRIPSPDTEIITLGTGSALPSTHRNVSSTLVRVPGCGAYIFDCGEGTLGSLRRLFSPPELQVLFKELKMIWISHMHADHHLGLTSVIKEWYRVVHSGIPVTASSSSVEQDARPYDELAIVSDKHMLNWLEEYAAVEDYGFSRIMPLATTVVKNALHPKHSIPAELWRCRLNQSRSESTHETTSDFLERMNLQHFGSVFVNHCRGAQAVSVTFNSGLKFSYSGDCRPSAEFAAIGKGSHILLHEATLDDDMRTEAMAKKHSTAGEALVVASKMQATACVLTHFSQRYPTIPSFGTKAKTEVEHLTENAGLDAVLENATNGEHQPELGAAIKDGVSAQPSNEIARNTRELTDDYTRLVTEGGISKLVSDAGIKVVSAFDYMRLKIRDIPKLERMQPVLRDVYEKLPEKADEAE